MGIATIAPVEPAALKYQTNSWNVEEIREWAEREFPEEFNALPNVSSFTFKTYSRNGVPVTNFRLLRLGKGVWATRHQRNPSSKIIYAFITGQRCNQIGFFVKDLSPGGPSSRLVDDLDDFVIDMGLQGLRHFDRPFRHLGDMSRIEYRASMPRFRALIMYIFMKADHINFVGGYQAYPRDFQLACSWIANGGVRPKCTPLSSTPRRQPRLDAAPAISASAIAQGNGVQMPNSSSGTEYQSSPVRAESAPVSHKPDPDMADNLDDAQKHGTHATIEDIFKCGRNLKRLLYEAGDTCDKMEKSKKRMKKDMDAIRAEQSELQTFKSALTAENEKLKLQVEEEKKRNDKLSQDADALSEIAKTAESKAKEANSLALLRSVHDRKQDAARIQTWKAKVTKAQAERDEEKMAGQAYKKKLEAMKADFETEKAEFADQVKREKNRADDAEAKLASIEAIFGKKI